MLNITSVNFREVPFDSDTIEAFCSLEFSEVFVVRNIKLIKSSKGKGPDYFLGFPSRESGGEYYDICYPKNKAVRRQLTKLIIKEYRKWLASEGKEEGQEAPVIAFNGDAIDVKDEEKTESKESEAKVKDDSEDDSEVNVSLKVD